MKKFFPFLFSLALLLLSAPVLAESIALDCILTRSPDWGARVTVDGSEVTSIQFSNRRGTVVSGEIPVTRDAEQTFPGFIYYRLDEDPSKLMRVEKTLLTEHRGRIYFLSPFVEHKDDEYACGGH